MYVKLMRLLLIVAVLALFWGCGTTQSQKKPAVDRPEIREENVPPGSQGELPSIENIPPAPPVGQVAPPVVDPGSQPPKRIDYKDRKGSGRSWKLQENSGNGEQ
jgi:hypothetical protein